jgi:brefeldin A-inhibited guanine nucleotide-exchange protein
MDLDFDTRLFGAALFLFHYTDCCVNNFQVFATASYDDHKNIVLLAFEIIEKILRDYFPYITETESSTFTDCVNCLIAFTNSRFNKDISLNAIGFLRFCAAKLAEGDIGSSSRLKQSPSSNSIALKDGKQEGAVHVDKDDNIHFWFPLLAGNYVLHLAQGSISTAFL